MATTPVTARLVTTAPASPGRRETQTFHSRDAELRRMSDWFRRFASETSFPEDKSLDMELCLNEILTNINQYAYEDSGPEREIRVTLHREGPRLEATIEDDGRPFNPVEAPEPSHPESLAGASIGGWGIPIVRSMANEVRYERRDGFNRLVIVFAVEPTP
jgi:serine/threonine-protein kinase RsbW